MVVGERVVEHVVERLGEDRHLAVSGRDLHPRLELAAFKERLNEANQRGLLRLERADLVEAMNPDDVRESETTFLTATYHFILIERDRP